MPLAQWISLTQRSSPSGTLVVAQSHQDIPFEISRVYYLCELTPSSRRGFHAHRRLEQVAICLHGRCQMLLDDGHERCNVVLDDPARGLRIRPMIWHEMFDFSTTCILMVLADMPYDEGDYIRDYSHFRDAIR